MNISKLLEVEQLSPGQCFLYRFAGFVLTVASIINLFVSFNYTVKKYVSRRQGLISRRISNIILSMLVSSILVIATGIPLVVVQCFTCRTFLDYDFICHLHGLICFSTGIFNMYILALLSVVRYLSVLHKSSSLHRFFDNHRDMSVVACGILSLFWSMPPFLNIGTHYVREGIGFYCSLDWHNPSVHSRIYLFVLIIFNYFIPFILLVFSNVRLSFTLHRLLKNREGTYFITTPRTTASSCTSSGFGTELSLFQTKIPKNLINAQLKQTTNRLQRLKLDRRYARMTAFIATQYLIAWTPYAIIAWLKLTGKDSFIEKNAFLPTFCAIIAKISLIINPLVLIYTSRMSFD